MLKEDDKNNLNNKETEIPLKNYTSVYGPTGKQLVMGLWWVKNRVLLQRIGYGIVILFSALTLGYGIYGFGMYVYSGMTADEEIAFDLSKNNSSYDIVSARGARDLAIGSVLVFSDNGNYNLAAEINNPNNNWYAEFDYFFVIGQQTTLVRRGFIMPNEKKYLTEFLYKSSQRPSQATTQITNISWQRIRPDDADGDIKAFVDEHLAIEANNIKTSNQGQMSRINFDLTNRTPYNYWEVDLYMLSKSGSRILDINKYQVQQLRSSEDREVSILWPGSLPSSRVEIIPSVNIFDEDNYMELDLGSGQEK